MGLDAVELIVGWEKAFGVEISDREAESLLTPKMAMDLLADKLGASTSTGICPTVRSHYAVRQAFQAVLGLQCQQVRLDSELKLLLPKQGYLEVWREIQYFIGAPEFPQLNFGLGVIFRRIEVRDLVNWLAAFYPCLFLNCNECWTYFQIRSVVRAVIREMVKENDFPDELDFRMLIG